MEAVIALVKTTGETNPAISYTAATGRIWELVKEAPKTLPTSNRAAIKRNLLSVRREVVCCSGARN